jgi:hypothetical protein
MASPISPSAGRKAEVQVSNAAATDYTAATYVNVERVNSPKFSGTLKKADTSSNDSGGDEENIPTWRTAKFEFEMVADAGQPAGQNHVWNAWLNGEIRAWLYAPTGFISGDTRYRFLGSIDDIMDEGPKEQGRGFKVTLTRTGGLTRDNQP